MGKNNNHKKDMQQTIMQLKKEITELTRWLILLKKAHPWDESLEDFILEKLNSMQMMVRNLQRMI